jgi:predicted DNA-binding transcriptional regulator YafY
VRLVHTLGLVAKGTVWYLVGDTADGMRTFRVDRVRSVQLTDEPVRRPPDFDLAQRWAEIMASLDDRRLAARAVALADADMIGVLRSVFGTRLSVGAPAEDGRVLVEVRGHSAEMLGSELAGFGDDLDVLEPVAVRRRLAHLGRALVRFYGSSDRGAT